LQKYDEVNPFLKWAGGKRQLLNELIERMPREFGRYYEPFLGGGALLLKLKPEHATVGDFSKELILAYNSIKNNVEELIYLLDKHEVEHQKDPKSYYYSIRNLDREPGWINIDDTVKAARMIYLNKACFNGLYRVNSKGFFNVPFNGKDVVNTYSKENISAINKYLNNHDIVLINGDFENIVSTAKKNDFIFFDPPYDILKKDTFDSYNSDPFGEEGQKRLAKVVKDISARGCNFILTNHNTPLINELYSEFTIDVVNVKRMINSNSNNRIGQEVIIYNKSFGGK
jgi:DNA adenine methylase